MIQKYVSFLWKREGVEYETWNFAWRQNGWIKQKRPKIVFFIFDPFMVKMQSEKYFCYFFQVTKEIQAKINELESESNIFA